VRETGKSIAQVARDLGISDGTLANWVKKDRQAQGGAAAGGLSQDERAELARLRRENAGFCVFQGQFQGRKWPLTAQPFQDQSAAAIAAPELSRSRGFDLLAHTRQ
jgi:transposase-like protein